MAGILSHFRIEALHNRHTIDVPINDNKLVLIGENGTGKSTVTNFIYFFLTRQWHRMLPYEFKRVVATINDKEIEFTKEDSLKAGNLDRYLKRRFPPRFHQRILEIAGTLTLEDLSSPRHIATYADEQCISYDTINRDASEHNDHH